MVSLKIPKASELIANNLREKIINGELAKGSFLPPEAQLIIDFGISRPTLREALRIIENEGLIEITRGARTGAKICGLPQNLLTKQLTTLFQYEKINYLDLYQSRIAFETFALREFCAQKDGAKIKYFRQIAENLRKLVEQEKFSEFPALMAHFHGELMRQTNNKCLSLIYDNLLNIIINHQLDFQSRFRQSKETLRKRFGAGYRSCVKLLNLVAENRTNEAIEHWEIHLQNVAQGWTIREESTRIIDGTIP